MLQVECAAQTPMLQHSSHPVGCHVVACGKGLFRRDRETANRTTPAPAPTDNNTEEHCLTKKRHLLTLHFKKNNQATTKTVGKKSRKSKLKTHTHHRFAGRVKTQGKSPQKQQSVRWLGLFYVPSRTTSQLWIPYIYPKAGGSKEHNAKKLRRNNYKTKTWTR